jgi:ribosome-associated translation inhibitor RaiA
MTNIAMYVANASNTKLQLWVDSLETLKRAVLKSLGKVIRQVIKASKVRFQLMTVYDIMTRVRQRYGKMEKDTKANLKERMLTMLPTTDGIDTHMSNLREMFDVSETAGFPVDNDRQVEIFRETVCAHPLIVKVLETFDFEFPDAKVVTFEQITEYLTLHLPNVIHAQMAATRATANLAAATAYSTLESASNKMKAELEKLKRKRNPNHTKRQAKTKKKNGEKETNRKTRTEKRTADEPTDNMNYCYAHGFQHSHNSSECKLLSGDKKQFTAEMRRSKGPTHPPGGSTKVNGQVPSKAPKTVTANMV